MKKLWLAAIVTVATILGYAAFAATTLLPNGQQCFQTAAGPLSAGSINMYSVGTTTAKTTWKDSSQTTANTNPIQLDSNGCAIIYGVGSYRQQVYTGPVIGSVTTGSLVYDLTTTDTSAQNSVFWAGTSSGTPNAITLTYPGFNATDGSVINFIPLSNNTGTTTINPSGYGAIPVVKDTAAGSVALTGGEIIASYPANTVSVVYSASQSNFHILNLVTATTTTPVSPPQGYLSLLSTASGGPVMQAADVTASSIVYYAPLIGNQIPIWNGSSYTIYAFSELTLTLTAGNNLASTIYDVCVFLNSGSPTLVTGPAWQTSTAGAGARGTPAAIARVNGLWVNNLSITAFNNGVSYSIPANQCTYIGSIAMDSVNGQVSAYRTFGSSRKFGVWNAYNRQRIYLKAGDSTASWTVASTSYASAHALSTNSLTVFSGLPEEIYDLKSFQTFATSQSGSANMQFAGALGFNSTTVASGINGTTGINIGSSLNQSSAFVTTASYIAPPSLGINTVTMLEKYFSFSVTAYGTETGGQLTASWRG